VNRDRDFLLDIVELIETINRHRPDTVDDFVGDEVLLTAVIHWVQTLGEAANGVSEETRSSYPDVPWRQVVDMRNLLADGYRYVDPAIVWQAVVGISPSWKLRSVGSSTTSQTKSEDRSAFDLAAHTESGWLSSGYSTLLPR
jgi:uncharacterized protein with HEPN domain